MTYLFYATLFAILVGCFAPPGHRWPDYLAAAALGADAVGLFLTARVVPGAVCLVLATVWLTLVINRRAGGTR